MRNLATQKIRDKNLGDIIDYLEHLWCFVVTKHYQDSNAQGNQNISTLESLTDQFSTTTLDDGAIKRWIANATTHYYFSKVYAKLILPNHDTNDENVMGADAFIMPLIRNQKLKWECCQSRWLVNRVVEVEAKEKATIKPNLEVVLSNMKHVLQVKVTSICITWLKFDFKARFQQLGSL